jgi:hypothetical protein
MMRMIVVYNRAGSHILLNDLQIAPNMVHYRSDPISVA